MRPPPFEFYAPTDLGEALTLSDQLGQEATFLAGGQTLLPLLNMRLIRPPHIIDLNRLAALSFIDAGRGGLRIGAMTRQYQIEQSAEVRQRCPLLAHAMPFVGHAQTRSRGTLGGSLAFASPVAEMSVVLLALGADVRCVSSSGARSVPIDEFFVDYLTSALQPDELLTEVIVQTEMDHMVWGFSELKLRSCDFPIVVAAVVLTLDDSSRCTQARIAVGGAALTPIRMRKVETELEGRVLSADLLQLAVSAAPAEALDPTDDVRASAVYRRAMVPLQIRQALTMALDSKDDH